MSETQGSRLERLPRVMSGWVTAIALIVLAGWVTRISLLKSFYPARVEMKIVTAVTFLFSAFALRFITDELRPRRRAAFLAGVVVIILGFVSLAQYIFDVDLLVDRMIVAERPGAAETVDPGRMAPQTTVLFSLLGLGILLAPIRTRVARRVQEYAVGVALILDLVTLLGYLYEIRMLRTWHVSTPVALSTALAFAFLGIGVAATRTDSSWMTLLSSPGPGGLLARRLVPAVIILTAILGWMRVLGQRLNLFNTETGVALFAASTCTAMTVLIWAIASRLELSDERRRRAEETLHALAVSDDVTHALNRRGFLDLAGRRLASSIGQTATLTLIDVDSLNLINDTFGAAHGDAALEEVAGLMTRVARSTDLVARIGGDRFAALSIHEANVIPFERTLQRAVDRRNEKTDAPYFLHLTTAAVEQPITSPVSIEFLLDAAQARLSEERRRRRKAGYDAEAVLEGVR